MDQPDPKVCQAKLEVQYLYSCENPDTLWKEEGLSNSCATFNANVVFEKEPHTYDEEIHRCEAQTSSEMEWCQTYAHTSTCDCAKGVKVKNLKSQSSAVSTSVSLMAEVGFFKEANCSEGISRSTSGVSGFASQIVLNEHACDGNSKEGKRRVHSINGIGSTQHISVQSDISSEIGSPFNEENGKLNAGRTTESSLNDGEGKKSITPVSFHDTQLKAESSSSNSTQISLPPSSNSYQEISVRGQSCKHCASISNFICMGCTCSMKEPPAGSKVLGIAAQVSQKVIEVLGMVAEQNSPIVKKVDEPFLPNSLLSPCNKEYSNKLGGASEVISRVRGEAEMKVGNFKEALESSSSKEEKIRKAVPLNLLDPADSNKNKCSVGTGQGIKLCYEPSSVCSNKERVDLEASVKSNKYLLSGEGSSQEMDPVVTHEINGGFTKKPEVAHDYQTSRLMIFDLNQDVQTSAVEYAKHMANRSVSSCKMINVSVPIPVVARSGVPISLSVMPLKLEGQLGWRGSSPTSAFRPALGSKNSSRNKASSIDVKNCIAEHTQVFPGIDLNVAAASDNSALEILPREHVNTASDYLCEESSVEVSSRPAERLNIDLNCLVENDDSWLQSSTTPVSLSQCSKVDFDLNAYPSAGNTCNDPCWPAQDCQLLRNKSFSHGHAPPFMVAAPNAVPPGEKLQTVTPLQQKLPYTPQVLSSEDYPYSNGFPICLVDPLPSTMHASAVLPYVKDSRGMPLFSQIPCSGTLSSLLKPPKLMEVADRLSPNNCTNIWPSFDVNNGAKYSANGNGDGESRQFLFPVKNSLSEGQVKSSQQFSFSATHTKRGEPEGGWDSLQPVCRQVTSLH